MDAQITQRVARYVFSAAVVFRIIIAILDVFVLRVLLRMQCVEKQT